MSKLFVRSENDGARNLFKKRTIYRSNMYTMSQAYPNIVDFNLGEKFFYGRTSQYFEPIIYRQRFSKLSIINSLADTPTRSPKVIDFVADVFNQMFVQFRKGQLTGKLSDDKSPISEFKIYKAFESPDILYREYVNAQMQTLITVAAKEKIVFENFDQFFEYFMKSTNAYTQKIPFTRPAFIKSKYCPITCSGLAIELDDGEYTNDEEKWNMIVKSPNWLYYVNLCNTYGFMIDMSYPMRIVADIDSEIMQESAAKYGLDSTAVILEQAYVPAHQGYLAQFKNILYNTYVRATSTKQAIEKDCGNSSIPAISKSVEYKKERFDEIYGDEFFLNAYFKMRFREEESHFTDGQKFRIIDDCMENYLINGLDKSMADFERILNKTFDYRGSVSYIMMQRRIQDK